MRRQTFPVVLMLIAGSAYAQHSHDDDLRSGNLPRRTAQVSDEVAREKLKSFGLQSVGVLREERGWWIASGEYEGRPITIEIDRQSGLVRERGKAEALLPARGAVPTIQGYKPMFDRAEIARAKLIVEPLPADRPETIRPLNDRPDVEKAPEPASRPPVTQPKSPPYLPGH